MHLYLYAYCTAPHEPYVDVLPMMCPTVHHHQLMLMALCAMARETRGDTHGGNSI